MWPVEHSARKRARARSSRRAKDRRGAAAIEYALVLSFISVAVVAAAERLGGTVDGTFGRVTSIFSGEGDGSEASSKSSAEDGKSSSSGGDKSKYGEGKSKSGGSSKGKSKGSNKH